MLLELAEDGDLGMPGVLPMLEVSDGARIMPGSGVVAAVPAAGLAVAERMPPRRAAAASPRLAARASRPLGGDAVDAAAVRRHRGVPLGGCVGERRAAALAATVTVIVRRRRLQAV